MHSMNWLRNYVFIATWLALAGSIMLDIWRFLKKTLMAYSLIKDRHVSAFFQKTIFPPPIFG